MADPFIGASRSVYDVCVDDLRAAVQGMGSRGLTWRPEAPETNSASVLVAHAMGSARDWVCIALGAPRPERSRAAEFLNTFASEEEALALIDEIRLDTLRVFDEAGAVDWSEVVSTVQQPGNPVTTRAYCLLHALEHLREHVAQLQLTRQLWDASKT